MVAQPVAARYAPGRDAATALANKRLLVRERVAPGDVLAAGRTGPASATPGRGAA